MEQPIIGKCYYELHYTTRRVSFSKAEGSYFALISFGINKNEDLVFNTILCSTLKCEKTW